MKSLQDDRYLIVKYARWNMIRFSSSLSLTRADKKRNKAILHILQDENTEYCKVQMKEQKTELHVFRNQEWQISLIKTDADVISFKVVSIEAVPAKEEEKKRFFSRNPQRKPAASLLPAKN